MCYVYQYLLVVLKLHLILHRLIFECRPDGLKKAYVKLTADYDAQDVASKIGII